MELAKACRRPPIHPTHHRNRNRSPSRSISHVGKVNMEDVDAAAAEQAGQERANDEAHAAHRQAAEEEWEAVAARAAARQQAAQEAFEEAGAATRAAAQAEAAAAARAQAAQRVSTDAGT